MFSLSGNHSTFRQRSCAFYASLFSVAMFLTACRGESEPVTADAENIAPVPVRVASVQNIQSDETLRFAGISRVRQRATLPFQVSGVVQRRDIEIGQQVDANQVLMVLYNPQLEPGRDAARARLQQLETDTAQAGRDLQRIEQLYSQGVVPIQDLEQQRARLDSLTSATSNARATLRQSHDLLAETSLRAPFAGVVEDILLEPGEFAQAGQPVIRIAANSGIEVEVSVPPHMLAPLEISQSLPVWSSLSGTQHQGTIVDIGQSNSGAGALYPLVVSIENSGLRSGEALEIGVPRRGHNATVVPMAAVMRSAEGLTVFRLEQNTVRRVEVIIDQLQGELAVLGDDSLSEGDLVVYAGLTRLADGDEVRVLP